VHRRLPGHSAPELLADLDTIPTRGLNYVSDSSERQKMLKLLPEITKQTRERCARPWRKATRDAGADVFIREVTHSVNGFSPKAKEEFFSVIDKVPMAFHKANAIFRDARRRRTRAPAASSRSSYPTCGKGCAACVTACGEHQALRMVKETEDVNARA